MLTFKNTKPWLLLYPYPKESTIYNKIFPGLVAPMPLISCQDVDESNTGIM